MASTTTLEIRRSRNFGDILNLTFEFFRANFTIVFKSVAFLAGPPVMVAVAIFATALSSRFTSFGNNLNSDVGPFLITLPIVVLLFVVGTTLAYGSVVEIVNLKALNPEEEITFEQVWQETRRDFMKILLTGIGSVILIGFATLLFIIPGIYLGVILSMIQIVRIHEEATFVEAMSRCNQLIKGYWWATFGFLFVVWLVMYLLSTFIQLPFQILIGGGMFFSSGSGGAGFGWLYIISMLVSTLVGLLVTSALVIAASLQYFNLVEKQEGAGLIRRIDSIGVGNLPQEGDESTW